ncbi:hypothetical protein B0I35DRAFT_496540 [Stachybotrys elegans]|uniref:Uncharacterized protein n=1 Tax=Stachybotrys elegans TaxID=80388 RepID=A0A8K0SWV7_9HYPO|nr:hypothetical protein B0I35DRAFT_496540 [Stachybotrys elegans]
MAAQQNRDENATMSEAPPLPVNHALPQQASQTTPQKLSEMPIRRDLFRAVPGQTQKEPKFTANEIDSLVMYWQRMEQLELLGVIEDRFHKLGTQHRDRELGLRSTTPKFTLDLKAHIAFWLDRILLWARLRAGNLRASYILDDCSDNEDVVYWSRPLSPSEFMVAVEQVRQKMIADDFQGRRYSLDHLELRPSALHGMFAVPLEVPSRAREPNYTFNWHSLGPGRDLLEKGQRWDYLVDDAKISLRASRNVPLSNDRWSSSVSIDFARRMVDVVKRYVHLINPKFPLGRSTTYIGTSLSWLSADALEQDEGAFHNPGVATNLARKETNHESSLAHERTHETCINIKDAPGLSNSPTEMIEGNTSMGIRTNSATRIPCSGNSFGEVKCPGSDVRMEDKLPVADRLEERQAITKGTCGVTPTSPTKLYTQNGSTPSDSGKQDAQLHDEVSLAKQSLSPIHRASPSSESSHESPVGR